MTRRFEKLLIWPMLFAAAVFLFGINWGLPSHRVDAFLFGNHPIWSGQQILQLLDKKDSLAIGADVDPDPIRTYGPTAVNDTDARRAEIVTRYRLYSDQPDEMITFRALSTIAKTHGDPRLYQYGGLWIYPVGALLKIASILGIVDLRSSQEFYLDHPEQFSRFYILARLYSVAWGLIGVWAVFQLAMKLTGDRMLAMFAGFGFALMPVVINMAHEAKPHLAGAVLTLLTICAAVRYLESFSMKWAVCAGALCGASCGMVLTGAISVVILPVMGYLRWRAKLPMGRRNLMRAAAHCVIALAVAGTIYFVANPFMLIHLIGDSTVLISNLRNSQAMYRTPPTWETIQHAGMLISAGATPVIAIGGGFAFLFLPGRKHSARSLLVAAMFVALVQFVYFATDKPGEYARFGLLIDVGLLLLFVRAIGQATARPRWRIGLMVAACAGMGIWSTGYLWHFVNDATSRPSRMIVAERVQKILERGGKEIAVYGDPAPYCLPPVNLFDWKIVRLEIGAAPPESADLFIRPIDDIPLSDVPIIGFDVQYWIRPRLLDTPISWAAKPFRVVARRGLLEDQKVD